MTATRTREQWQRANQQQHREIAQLRADLERTAAERDEAREECRRQSLARVAVENANCDSVLQGLALAYLARAEAAEAIDAVERVARDVAGRQTGNAAAVLVARDRIEELRGAAKPRERRDPSNASPLVRCWRCKHDVPEVDTVCNAGIGTQCKDTQACRGRWYGPREQGPGSAQTCYCTESPCGDCGGTGLRSSAAQATPFDDVFASLLADWDHIESATQAIEDCKTRLTSTLNKSPAERLNFIIEIREKDDAIRGLRTMLARMAATYDGWHDESCRAFGAGNDADLPSDPSDADPECTCGGVTLRAEARALLAPPCASPGEPACRRCSECRGQGHHWIEDGGLNEDGSQRLPYACKHCPAEIDMCDRCSGADEPGHGCEGGDDGDEEESSNGDLTEGSGGAEGCRDGSPVGEAHRGGEAARPGGTVGAPLGCSASPADAGRVTAGHKASADASRGLDDYARHDDGCASYYNMTRNDSRCDCGLTALRATSPHILAGHPARPWVNEALNRLLAGDEPDSAIPLLRAALAAFSQEPT